MDYIEGWKKLENNLINLKQGDRITYENAELFYKIVENFLKPKEVHEGTDRKCVEKELQKYMNNYVREKESQLEQIKNYRKSIMKMEIKEYEIITGIKGIFMRGIRKVELGKFTIYDIFTIDRYIDKESNLYWIERLQEKAQEENKKMREKYKIGGVNEDRYLVSVKIKAKSSTFAVGIAKKAFSYLENVLRIFISQYSTNLDLGIYNFENFNIVRHYILLDGKNVSFNNDLYGASMPIQFNEILDIIDEFNLNYIWEVFFKQQKTDMDQRIIRAINWTGKGLRDNDKGRSLVQYTIALEALLQKKKTNELVGPSITQGIADGLAFMLYNTLQDRLDTISMVSKIYNERSNVVHGTNEEVNERNVSEAFTLVRELIFKLLSYSGNKFSEIDDVLKYVKEMKYSFIQKNED